MRTRLLRSKHLLLTGVAVIVLTTNLFGQLFVEERLFCLHLNEDTSYLEFYIADNTRVESSIVAPIENGFTETKLYTEQWMTVPFESSIAEEVLHVESWMTVLFEMDEEMEVESWMTTDWI